MINTKQENQLLSATAYSLCKNLFNRILDIPYAVVKGEALSFQAYGKLGYRKSSDIDILVDRKHLIKVENFLCNVGFQPAIESRRKKIAINSLSHQTVPWKKQVSDFLEVNIDLNHDIFWGEYTGKRIGIDEFVSDAVITQIYGQNVKILTPEKAFVQFILHCYKDMNSIYLLATRKNNFPKTCRDIYAFIYRFQNNNWKDNRLYNICNKYEILPYAYCVLYHVSVFLKDDNLFKLTKTFETDLGNELLNKYGLSKKEQKTWKYDIKTRLTCQRPIELIKDQLTENDIKKIEYNNMLFQED